MKRHTCYNDSEHRQLSGTLNGTYFFNGTVDIGNSIRNSHFDFVWKRATISKTTGNPTIQLTGLKDHPQRTIGTVVSSQFDDRSSHL